MVTMLRWLATLLLGTLLGCDHGAAYRRQDGQWTFDGRPLAGGGVTELTVLNPRFAKTAGQVFYRWHEILGADAAGFEALDEHHARDRERVYHADTWRDSSDYFSTQRVRVKVLAGADPASFELMGQGYARDRQRVYFDGDSFPVKDAASFEVLDYGFARDRQRAYYLREPVPGSDGGSFSVIDAHHARDARGLFHAELDYAASPPRVAIGRIAGADPASFEPLGAGYARDSRRVYWRGRALPGADPASFMLIEQATAEADARDAQRRYLRGSPAG